MDGFTACRGRHRAVRRPSLTKPAALNCSDVLDAARHSVRLIAWTNKPPMHNLAMHLDQLGEVEFLFALVAVLLAGISRGMLGFGATLIIVPCLITLYGPIEAVAVASIIEIPAVLYLLPATIREANWRHIAPLGFASLTTIPLGAWALVSVDPDLSRRIIAMVVIVFGVALASGWRYRGTPGLGMKIGIGAASGIMGGMANISGPLVVMFLVASNTAAAGVRAGIMAFFSFSAVYRVVVYALVSLYAWPIATIAFALCVPYLLGITIGKRLFAIASEKLFMRLAIGVVLGAGLVALLK